MEVNRVLEPGGSLVVMPFAWMTGNHWLERFAAWLFQITGQSPPTKAPEIESILRHPFESCGFSVHTERKKLDTSEVLIIIAKKPK
jgi:ubiquinone/menaquinone biosynthesis C-methylase UbiE